MVDKEMAKVMVCNILFQQMLEGEVIKIEYGTKEKMEEARRYFPQALVKCFTAQELVDTVEWAMGLIHKVISETGQGEVLMIHALELKVIIYGMQMYRN